MKVYTIIGGVNGTGKSSLTGVLRAQRNDLGVIVDVDRITALAGVSPLEGGKMAIRRIDDCLDKGISFTQESTLSGFRTAQTAARAKQDGYTVRLYYVGLDTPEESLARIANRVKRGGHNIGTEDVLRRFAGRWEAVSKVRLCRGRRVQKRRAAACWRSSPGMGAGIAAVSSSRRRLKGR